MEGILYIENFISQSQNLFQHLEGIAWDERMASRKTASFGVAYNYSQISYPEVAMPTEIENIAKQVATVLDFEPNNCLINYYLDGKSKMGYHSDQIDILFENTGIAIVSVGATRILRFRNIQNPETIIDYPLPSGSLIYMNQEIQNHWHHAIPKGNTEKGRMSLTFRKIR
ncbi:MAG: alpha-ketoglutarate-dependent dioxygenase AlkB [Limnohabitans sp.]|nr:alpha-ketoglutarate-dependent dioxygenase AlkB [Limnohabitans sp.]